MSLKNDSIISLFSEYLLREHRSDIYRISLLNSEPHQSIIVHFNNLCEFNSIFSELLLSKPNETLNLLNQSVRQVIQSNQLDEIKSQREESSLNKSNVHIRLTALPIIPEVYKNHIPTSNDIGKFIALRAIVSRVGPIQIIEGEAKYLCQQCGHIFTVLANYENQYSIKPPRFCPKRQASSQSCSSMNLKRLSITGSQFSAKNYQEIRVHEQFGCLTVGVMRKSICVSIEDDLLECVKPGDEVVVNGIVTRRWRSMREGLPCEISTYLKANYIENLTEIKAGGGPSQISYERVLEFEAYWNKHKSFCSALEARNLLLRSICPEVYGMYLIKLSLALMLASAPEWHSTSGESSTGVDELSMRIRGNPHILLIGDPGTAKSVLLRGCTALCERAVLTAATGTTAAGLTATAVRDSTGWTLDAGALVLADGGLCAIDEFTALHGAHRAAVHEAMEQQTISLAKAGLMARLNCRCSVLAAANPTPSSVASGSEDFGLPTPLLSRFDLIWRLVDPIDSVEWDRRIANFVLDLDQPRNSTMNNGKNKLTLAAANLLQRYYVWQRSQMSAVCDDITAGAHGRRTLRLLESLVRLTKAHARLMCRNEAIIEDAVVVIYLVDCSLYSTGSIRGDDGRGGNTEFTPTISLSKCISPELIVSTNIPENASHDYAQIEKLILTTLNSSNTNSGKSVEHIKRADNLNLAKQFNQYHDNIQLEPLLSSTQLVNNNKKKNMLKTNSPGDEVQQQQQQQQQRWRQDLGQRHNLSANNNHNNKRLHQQDMSSLSVVDQENDTIPVVMTSSSKKFKWIAVNESVDISNSSNHDNSHKDYLLPSTYDDDGHDDEYAILSGKPLCHKHTISNSYNIPVNKLPISTATNLMKSKDGGVKCSSILDNDDNNNNNEDIISFGFKMVMNSESILNRQLNSEDFEIDL
uniref:DNA helicase MCM9 n=1 Tax=Trichobilharzia regenti TaxID=157069 RepID=A0AA85KMB3_TRIRE|nr:unnamed protein product [Trichobilharzia regenti]